MAEDINTPEQKALLKVGNSILNNAKYSSNNTDEWYTTYETIAEELEHYLEEACIALKMQTVHSLSAVLNT